MTESEGVYIYGETAVDGKARVGKVDAEPLEGLDGDASAIIQVVDTAARGDGVCMTKTLGRCHQQKYQEHIGTTGYQSAVSGEKGENCSHSPGEKSRRRSAKERI